jgi:hypothetical protein
MNIVNVVGCRIVTSTSKDDKSGNHLPRLIYHTDACIIHKLRDVGAFFKCAETAILFYRDQTVSGMYRYTCRSHRAHAPYPPSGNQ